MFLDARAKAAIATVADQEQLTVEAPSNGSFPTHPTAPEPRAGRRPLRFAPYLIGLFFALWGLRGVTANNVVDTDAARHAMNGAFIYDWVRSGHLASPIEYGKHYYSHLPALSLPYHPPLFPALEALFFWGGVNLLAARLAVALAVAISAVLFYKLLLATHGSQALAIVATVTFFSWRTSQFMAGDVMLEFPALALALGSLYCLRHLDQDYPLGRGLGFALLAAAAVWSKQQAVFLGLVPFAYVLLARRWRLLAGKTIWISSFLFGALVISLTLLSLPFRNAGVNQISPRDEVVEIFVHNLGYYLRVFQEQLGIVPAVFTAIAFAVFLLAPRRRRFAADDLYLAWAGCAFVLLLLIGPYSVRYLFFVFPAVVAVGYAALFQLCRAILPPRRAWCPAAGLAAVYFVWHLNTPPTFMRGPSDAAQAVVSGAPNRVLYCGETDGSFVFAVRSLDPRLRTVVIRGGKLPESTFETGAFESFAHRYGVRYVIFERTKAANPWDRLRTAPPPSLILERNIPLVSSSPRWNGDLLVYRFTNPSPNPDAILRVPIPMIGSDLDANLDNGLNDHAKGKTPDGRGRS